MLADSSFGSEGDESVMSFAVPNLGNKTVLVFLYRMSGENGGSLEVSYILELLVIHITFNWQAAKI